MTGAAFFGGRRVYIDSLLWEKVGSMGIDLGISVVDSQGNELLSSIEQLICGEKANCEYRFVIKDPESYLQLKIRSLSTIHSVYAFASLFPVTEEEIISKKK